LNFGILIFPDVEELDFVGPWEMVGIWSDREGGPENCLIIAESKEPVKCSKGLTVVPDVTIDECPDLDFLLVPGGRGTRKEVDNPKIINFITEKGEKAKTVLSVCTGSFLLQRAGLLSGKRATTHWGSLDRLRELGDVEVVEERFTRDDKVWTAAGISAGIDMTLAFIASFTDEKVAGRIQLYAEYYPSQKLYGEGHNDPGAPGYIKRGRA